MFNKLMQGMGQQPTEDEIDPEFSDMYQDSFVPEEDERMDSDPEAVLNDPTSSVEIKQQAMQKVLDKYLKPKEK